MRIGVLSRGRQNYTIRRIMEAAHAQRHRVTLMDPFDCTLYIRAGRPLIAHNGRSVDRLDVLLPRLSPQTARYGIEVVAHFEDAGVPSVNPSGAIETARSKWRTLRALSRQGIPVPPSFAAGSARFLDKAVGRIGGYPFLIKPFEGTQGLGIMLFETPLTARSAMDTLWALRQDYVAQEFYPEATGRDTRVLVVAGRALGAMERIAMPGDFRANVHQGALGRAVPFDPAVESLAVCAAAAVGLRVTGVDLLLTESGPVVLEVNPSPGFEEFERVTGCDVAAAIVSCCAAVGDTPITVSCPRP
jgi:ribosomal protein S6--L-glutamate ligase